MQNPLSPELTDYIFGVTRKFVERGYEAPFIAFTGFEKLKGLTLNTPAGTVKFRVREEYDPTMIYVVDRLSYQRLRRNIRRDARRKAKHDAPSP